MSIFLGWKSLLASIVGMRCQSAKPVSQHRTFYMMETHFA